MEKTSLYHVYYDLGIFKIDFRNVEKFLDNPLSFLTSRDQDVCITVYRKDERIVTCGREWHDLVTVEILQGYYLSAKKIYKPKFQTKSMARAYYKNYLGKWLDTGDLRSLMEKEESYALFLLMYLLMLRDNVIIKTVYEG